MRWRDNLEKPKGNHRPVPKTKRVIVTSVSGWHPRGGFSVTVHLLNPGFLHCIDYVCAHTFNVFWSFLLSASATPATHPPPDLNREKRGKEDKSLSTGLSQNKWWKNAALPGLCMQNMCLLPTFLDTKLCEAIQLGHRPQGPPQAREAWSRQFLKEIKQLSPS